MKFKVKCIQPMTINLSVYNTGENFTFIKDEIYTIKIDDYGVRFLINNVYSLPYNISSIENYFISI